MPSAPASAEGSTILDFFVSPVQGNPRGLAYDGTFLYLTNHNPAHLDKVYQVDPSTGQLVGTFVHGLGHLAGLAYDCSDGTFWAGDYNTEFGSTGQTIYHLDSDWNLLESFDTPEVETDLGGIDGLTVVGSQIWVSGDLATRVHRYTKAGAYVGVAVDYYPYRNSGLGYDGTSLWGVFTDWGFIAKYPPLGPPWDGFYTGYYWSYGNIGHNGPASGFIEDLEIPCGEPTRLWAHGIRFTTNESVVIAYDVSTDDQLVGTDCEEWLWHFRGLHGCGSPQATALQPDLAPPWQATRDFRMARSDAVPSAATSTVDPCLVTCPGGDIDFDVVVRDASNNPIQGSIVTLNFQSCGAFQVCPDPAPYTVNPGAWTVTMVTGPTGLASFPLRMGGTCAGQLVTITADGFPLASRSMTSTDQNGDLVVSPLDLPLLLLRAANDPLGDLDCDGVTSCPATGVAGNPIPVRFGLGQVWPNPLRGGVATVALDLPVAGDVRMELYDIAGRRLAATVVTGLASGRHNVRWGIPSGVAPGIYSLRAVDGRGGQARRQMVVVGP